MRTSERKMTLLQQQSSSSRRLLDAAKEAEGLLQQVGTCSPWALLRWFAFRDGIQLLP